MRIFSLSLILRHHDHWVVLLVHTRGDLVVIEDREVGIAFVAYYTIIIPSRSIPSSRERR